MGSFIIRYKGRGTVPAADLARIRDRPGVKVLDTADRMLLVQSSPDTADELARLLPDWLVTPEKTVPLPDARPRPRSGPAT